MTMGKYIFIFHTWLKGSLILLVRLLSTYEVYNDGNCYFHAKDNKKMLIEKEQIYGDSFFPSVFPFFHC